VKLLEISLVKKIIVRKKKKACIQLIEVILAYFCSLSQIPMRSTSWHL